MDLAVYGSGTGPQPFVTAKDYDRFLKRVREFPRWADGAIAQMRTGLSNGITFPRVVMAKVAPQMREIGATALKDNIFWAPITAMPKEIPAEEPEGKAVLGKVPSVLFTLFVLLVVAAALYESRSFPYLGAIFPMAATIPAVFMAIAQLVLELRAANAAPGIETWPKTKLSLGYFLSLVLFLCLILLLGFGIATALFTFVFLYGWVRTGWLYALIYTGSVVGVALLMSQLLALYWPQGILLG
jgi:hypothetical protein